MSIKINGKIVRSDGSKPRRPARADQSFDHLQLEGQGYNKHKWLNGQNPKDPNNWARRGHIPLKSYKDFEPGESRYRKPVAPRCPVCDSECTNWTFAHSGTWWCHSCSAKIKGVYSPEAMLPLDAGDYLEPSLSDRHGALLCKRCAVEMLPRSDNQGYDCPTCATTHKNPAPVRPGPII